MVGGQRSSTGQHFTRAHLPIGVCAEQLGDGHQSHCCSCGVILPVNGMLLSLDQLACSMRMGVRWLQGQPEGCMPQAGCLAGALAATKALARVLPVSGKRCSLPRHNNTKS